MLLLSRRPADDDRRLRLTALSRHEETQRHLVIELTADGADYQSLGDFAPDPFGQGLEVLHGVLEDADQRLTRRQLLKHWPQDFPAPDETTLWRRLDRAVHDGTGRKNAPYRYCLGVLRSGILRHRPLRAASSVSTKKPGVGNVYVSGPAGAQFPAQPPCSAERGRRSPHECWVRLVCGLWARSRACCG